MTDGKKNPDTSGSTAMSNVAYKRSWRDVFLQSGSLSAKKHPEAVVEAEPPLPKSERMPLRGDFTLMSFERHGEIYPKRWGADPKTDAPAPILWMSFQLAIPWRGCSPALPASASPAEGQYMPDSSLLCRGAVRGKLRLHVSGFSVHRGARPKLWEADASPSF